MFLDVILQTAVLCCVTLLCWFWCYELCCTLLRWSGDLAQARTVSVSSFLTAFHKENVLRFQQSWKGRRSLWKISIIFAEFCRYFPKWSSFMCSLPIAISTREQTSPHFPFGTCLQQRPHGRWLGRANRGFAASPWWRVARWVPKQRWHHTRHVASSCGASQQACLIKVRKPAFRKRCSPPT